MIPMSEEDAEGAQSSRTADTGSTSSKNGASGSGINNPEDANVSDPETGRKKKPRISNSYLLGIVALSLLAVSVTSGVLGFFIITPFAAGLSLLGMLWYVRVRRRSSSDGVIFYSHSQILYYWPIWVGAFVISDLAEIDGISISVNIVQC